MSQSLTNSILPSAGGNSGPSFTIKSDGEDVGTMVRVASFMTFKGVNRISSARIAIYDGDVASREFALSNDSRFAPGKTISIEAGANQLNTPIFEGIIIKHSLKSPNDSAPLLILEIKDVAVRTTVARRNRIFRENITDKAAIELVLQENGIEGNVQGLNSQEHAELVQYYSTDWDFIVSRAEVNSQLVFVNDGRVTVKTPELNIPPTCIIAYGRDIIDFDLNLDSKGQYAAVESSTWDFSNQKFVSQGSKKIPFREQGNLSTNDLSDVIGLDNFPMQHTGRLSKEELSAWSSAKLLRSQLSKIVGKIKLLGNPAIQVGEMVEIKGISDLFNGNAFVSGVTHYHSDQETFYTEIEVGLHQEWFSSRFTDVLDRPAAGLLPGIFGLQNGIITNIHEDPESQLRVQVKIPIIDNEGNGIWARLGQFYAGNDDGNPHGAFFLPEVGDEVIVGFLNNDPRDAIVIASVYSAAGKAPFEADEPNTIKGFVTKEQLKLSFDEEKKAVTVETPAGNKVELSDEEEAITLTDQHNNKIIMNADGISFESAKDVVIKAPMGDVNVEGVNISLAAQAAFEAEGTSSADISSPAVASIKGATQTAIG